MNILVWYENQPLPEAVPYEREVYPKGIHGALRELFSQRLDCEVRTGVSQDEAHGLSDENLDWADVLVYFGHKHWRDVPDDRVDKMQQRVLEGMGLVLLHSSHASKIFARMMGTRTQCLRWREGAFTGSQRANGAVQKANSGEWQRVWLVNPAHPIARGLQSQFFEIPQDETYGEYFEIPQPEEQVFLTTSEGGEVLRSGNCWTRGRGKIFYFSSGHETFPVYYQPEIQQILVNALQWAAADTVRKDWPVWAREAERE